MTIVTSGLVAYYHYKRGVRGTTWYNLAPSTKGTNNATINGATLTDSGMYFDGVNDFIEILNFANTGANTTIEVGFKHEKDVDDNTDAYLISSSTYNSGILLQGFSFTRDLEFKQSGSFYNTTTPYARNTQYRLTGTSDGSQYLYYTNGNQSGHYTSTNGMNLGGTIDIGKQAGATNGYFKGYIQYVRIYNRQLTATEISQNSAVVLEVGIDAPTTTGSSVVPASFSNLREFAVNPLNINFVWDYQTDATQYTIKRNGSIVYQGIDNMFNDTPLLQKTTYNYEIYATNEIGNNTSVLLTFTTPALTMFYLPVGSRVKMGVNEFTGKRVNGTEDIYWTVLSQQHWLKDTRYPQNATTMITEKVIKFQAFDTDIPTVTNGVTTYNGSRNWWASNIRQWLNSDADAGQWFTPKYAKDTAPTSANLKPATTNYFSYPYDQDKGFMRSFTDVQKSVLKPTNITERAYVSDMSVWGESEWWTNDYFFLLGAGETSGGGATDPVEGDFSDGKDGYYFDNLVSVGILATDLAWSNYSTLTQPSTGVKYWTRSHRPYDINSTKVWDSSSSLNGLGWQNNTSANTNPTMAYGIRPLCNVDNTTLMEEILDGNGVGTGVYQIASTQQYKKRYPSTTTVKELPLNSIIKMGTNKFADKRVVGSERMYWRVLSNNHWLKDHDYPTNAVTIMSERIIRYMAFTSIDTPNGFPKGADRWIFSTLSNYLNSSELAGKWFEANAPTPNAPDYDHILHKLDNGTDWFNEPYDKDNGFLTFFTSKELSAVLDTETKTIQFLFVDGNGRDIYNSQLNAYKFYLPSFREIIGVEEADVTGTDRLYITEGRLFNIDNRLNMLDALDTDLAFYNSPFWQSPEKRNDRKKSWMRTYDISPEYDANVINGATYSTTYDDNGTLGFTPTKDHSALAYGIRPVCNLDGDTQVHLTEVVNGVPVYEIEDSTTIEYTGYEWSNDVPEINPPIIPPDTTAPSEVGTVSTTVTTDSVIITWSNPTEADFDHINIYKNGLILVKDIKDTTYTVTGLSEGQNVSFRITTVDLTGNESSGTIFSATTASIDITPPNDVINLKETHTDSTVTLTWTNPIDDDFAYVRVYQNNTIVFDNYHSTTASMVSIPSNTTQTFKVTTTDLDGNESNGAYITVTTSATASPDDVKNLTAKSSYSSITLYWDEPDSTDYNYANIYMNGSPTPYIGTSNISIAINGLVADTQYSFRVVAVDLDGNTSSGVTIVVNTLANPDGNPPAEVTGLSQTHTDTTATLTWNNPSDSDFVYVKVYYKNMLVKDNIASGTVTISGLSNNSEYTFKVCTVDKAGNISAGTTITLTTNDSTTGIYKTIGDLPIGARFKMGKSSFESGSESIYWTVISKNHFKKDSGYPEGVTFITDKNIKYVPFDTLGRKTYAGSEIAYWLQMGFMNGFSSIERNAMISTTTKYNGGSLVAKAFLPSSAEVQDTFVDANNGVLFQYFADHPTFKYVASQQLAFDNAVLNGTVNTLQPYWLRDSHNGNMRYIATTDSVRVGETANPKDVHGIRPLTNLNTTTLIEAVAGETGVYQIKGSSALPVDTSPSTSGGQVKVKKDNNCQIHILNPSDLSIDGIVDNYESASMTVNYNTVGDFIIVINNRLDNARLFVKEKYVVFNGDGKFAGLITSVQIELDEDGQEVRTIKGKTLGHLLSYRVVAMDSDLKTSDNYSGLGEKAIKYYVRKNTNESPVDKDKRSLPNFVITADKNLGQNITRQYYYDNLLDVVEEISQLQNLGYEIYYDIDSNKIVFDVYSGRDLSVNQSDYSPIMLSANIGNLEGQTYIYDEYNDKNFAYINRNDTDLDGDGVPDAGQLQVIQINKDNVSGAISSGITRKEVFFKIDSMEKGYYVPSTVLGQEKLNAQAMLETFEVRVMDNQMFTFGVDYELGDIVTIYNESWSVTSDLKIVGVTLDMSSDREYNISLTFGDVIPTLTDKIEQVVESYDPNKNTQW